MSSCVSAWRNLTNRSSTLPEEFENDLHHLKLLAYGCIGAVVVGVGIIGNLLNLVVLTRPTLHGITFTYLSSLAVSDLLTLIFCSTSLIRLLDAQPKSFAAAVYFSHLELPVVNAFMASSVFHVVCVTVDRYFSVCHPTKFKEVHNELWAKKMIVCSYVMAFVIYIPICFEKFVVLSDGDPLDVQYLACENPLVVHNVVYKTYLLIKECVVRLGPVLLLVFFNLSMILSLHRRRKQIQSQSSSFRKKMRDEHRLFVLLASIMVLFFVCMTPAAVLTLLHTEEKDLHYDFQVFRAVANVLEVSNYSMNFYVYCFCSSEIRGTFFRIFRKSPLQAAV